MLIASIVLYATIARNVQNATNVQDVQTVWSVFVVEFLMDCEIPAIHFATNITLTVWMAPGEVQ